MCVANHAPFSTRQRAAGHAMIRTAKQARPCDLKPVRRVTVLGATGSIGDSTVDLLARAPERYDVVAVTGGRNVARLAQVARMLGAERAVIADPALLADLRTALSGSDIEAAAGPQAIVEAAKMPADWVMAAIAGAAGLAPTWAAMEQGTTVALANKECLVTAGRLFMAHAQRTGVRLLPVDSEHSAIFQCLDGCPDGAVQKIVLTASGGPFRTWSAQDLKNVTPDQALKHPNWSMGAKVTIDSATLMNKGLELIEAHHLFACPSAQLDAVVHPQSIIHGLVYYRDGSVLAQLGVPDMRAPIAYALSCPDRDDTPVATLDLIAAGTLEFSAPDLERFPCLGLARAAMDAGDAPSCALNAANEIAVEAFLKGRLSFLGIAAVISQCLERLDQDGDLEPLAGLEDVATLDAIARTRAASAIDQGA